MDNNNSQKFADLWPSASLLRATTAVSRPPKTLCLTCFRKQSQQKQTHLLLVVCQWWLVSLLIKLSIGSENCDLSLSEFSQILAQLVIINCKLHEHIMFGSMIKHDHNLFVIAFCVLLDFMFGLVS